MFCSDNKHILDLQTIHGQNLWQMYEAKMMIKMVGKKIWYPYTKTCKHLFYQVSSRYI